MYLKLSCTVHMNDISIEKLTQKFTYELNCKSKISAFYIYTSDTNYHIAKLQFRKISFCKNIHLWKICTLKLAQYNMFIYGKCSATENLKMSSCLKRNLFQQMIEING